LGVLVVGDACLVGCFNIWGPLKTLFDYVFLKDIKSKHDSSPVGTF